MSGALGGDEVLRFGAFGITCVAGLFARTGVGEEEPDDGTDSLAPCDEARACWKAPRCESAPLTASGDTGDASGADDGAPPSKPEIAITASGTAATGVREFGEAVAANGLTGARAGDKPLEGPDVTGVPQPAQNFADDVSSAWHFAHFAMATHPC